MVTLIWLCKLCAEMCHIHEYCFTIQTHTLPEMTPLARPGIPAISEKLLELKYLSQEALSSGPSQKSFQMLVVSFTRAGAGLGSNVGPTVPFSNGRNTVCKKIKNKRNGCE